MTNEKLGSVDGSDNGMDFSVSDFSDTMGWKSIDWSSIDVWRHAPNGPPKEGTVQTLEFLGGTVPFTTDSAVIADDNDDETTTNIIKEADHHDEGSALLEERSLLRSTLSPWKPSPVEQVMVRDRMVYLKRDDLLRLESSHVSGNKARKFLALNALPSQKFPQAIVSYGGPQSNAMLALAAICHSKNNNPNNGRPQNRPNNNEDKDKLSNDTQGGVPVSSDKKRFVYYTKKIPRYLRKQPSGNLLRALSLGMEVVELSHVEYGKLFGGDHGGSPMAPAGLEAPIPDDSVWIPQGGACSVAIQGAKVLADEIVSYWTQHGRGRPLSVCMPGGTCTTALLLEREIRTLIPVVAADGATASTTTDYNLDIEVVVIPCVGDDAYARRQMLALDLATGGTGRTEDLPKILRPLSKYSTRMNESSSSSSPSQSNNKGKKTDGYFSFGTPDEFLLDTFTEMKEQDVFVDLLYGAPAWNLLLQHWCAMEHDDSPIAGRQVMYVHSGGLEGISSQLTRYKHAGLVNAKDIQ